MKKSILALAAMVAMVLSSCNEPSYMPTPGNNDYNLDSIPVTIPDTNGIEISVDSARIIGLKLAKNATTAEVYKLTGVIKRNATSPMSVPGYTNINFDLTDNGGKTIIDCHYTNNLYNRPFRRSSDVPRVGSKLAVVGVIGNYNGTPQLQNGYIIRIDSMVAPPPFPGCPEPAEDEISVSKAVEIAAGLASGKVTTETYNIMGVVTEVSEVSTSNGNATFYISDGKQYFYIYRSKGMDGEKFTDPSEIQPNDTVTVNAKITNYKGTYETSNGTAKLVKTTNPNW